jgi:hypothetical protein
MVTGLACFVIKTPSWKNKPRGEKEERVTRVLGRPYNKSIILFPKAKEKKLPQRHGDARRISAVKYKLFSFLGTSKVWRTNTPRAACIYTFLAVPARNK